MRGLVAGPELGPGAETGQEVGTEAEPAETEAEQAEAEPAVAVAGAVVVVVAAVAAAVAAVASPPRHASMRPAQLASGYHMPGTGCLAAGCHGGNVGARLFTAGGTAYFGTGGNATVALPGATVKITQANGQVITVPTAQNGNFWTKQALAYPIRVEIACRNTQVMNAPAQSGDCNSCHGAGNRIWTE